MRTGTNCVIAVMVSIAVMPPSAAWPAGESTPSFTVHGIVQYQDLRRAGQALSDKAIVQLRDEEGTAVAETVTNDAGEFELILPTEGTYSVSATQGALRSEYVVINADREIGPVTLTLAPATELAIEVVSRLPPLQYRASTETYSLSRKDIEAIPRGNNVDANDLLATVPSAIPQPLKQISIRQDHANIQYRIDGVPIPETVSATFSDVITPRAWERADILLGGLEAQYGNRTAALIDITSKSGTKPGFGSLQIFGGSNQTVQPSFEYGGTIGQKFRYYVLNSYAATNRGIEPRTLGHSVFHDHNERNQTYLRGDYQHDNHNNFTWLFLNSVAKYQIPTAPGLAADSTVVGLLQARMPAFSPVPSQAVDEFQRENNQYGHMVWRRDINASSFFAVAAYGRQTRAMFKTDPFNVLSYTGQQAADQDRMAYSGGLRFDYTHMPNDRHLIKAGFQFDRTQTVNKTMLYAFDVDPLTGNPTGSVVTRNADNRVIGYREEFWLQDQWLVTPRWTLNLGVRGDIIQYQYNEGQVSPRLGVTYRANDANVFHAFYGRMFQPPNLEQIPFALLNTVGTTAEPDNLTANKTRAERSHYFEIGSYHALTRNVWLELTGYYKLSRFQQDAGQFGTTPLLNYFAFDRGFQRGVDAALKVQVTDGFYARGNVAWGQCKGYGLASGHFLLDQKEIGDINTPSGVFCDHSQTVTSSAVAAYRIRERTTISAQMLYASGLRTSGDNAKTNSSHFPSYTVYNASITHVVTLPWPRQKLLLGVDVINLLDHAYFYNTGEGSIGLGVSHAGMPRSVFFRAQYLF